MPLLAIGLNHTTAPVSIRERVTFGPDIVVAALRSLTDLGGIGEAVILSTCNRTEIYCDALGDAHGLGAGIETDPFHRDRLRGDRPRHQPAKQVPRPEEFGIVQTLLFLGKAR